MSHFASATQGALTVFLKPKMGADNRLNLSPILAGTTRSNFRARKEGIAAGVRRHVAGRLARDANLNTLAQLLDAIELDSDFGSEPDAGGHQAFRQANHQSKPVGRDTLDNVGSDTEEHVGNEYTPPNERGTGVIAASMSPPAEAVDEYTDESGLANKEASTKGTGQKLGGETRIRSTRSGAENETDVDVNAIVNRIVKDECNKLKEQWAKDYKFARDMIVTNPVGPPSFAGEPQREGTMAGDDDPYGGCSMAPYNSEFIGRGLEKDHHSLGEDEAYETAPRPAAAGSALDTATRRLIDRVVGAEVTQMINNVMWQHGLAFDQTTGRVNDRMTRERRLAQDSRLDGLGALLDQLEHEPSKDIFDDIVDPRRGVLNPSPAKSPVSNSPAFQGNQRIEAVPPGEMVDEPEKNGSYNPIDVNKPGEVCTNQGKSAEDEDLDTAAIDPQVLNAFLAALEKGCPPEQLEGFYDWLGSVNPSLLSGGDVEPALGGRAAAPGTSAMSSPGQGMDAAFSVGNSDSVVYVTRAHRLRMARRAWSRCRARGASDAALGAAVRAIGRSLAARAVRAK
jgi:hypothetical protein